ncbi:zinc knuckle CX2CX4HX4C containing protein, partial [Tanacetum coccineum]
MEESAFQPSVVRTNISFSTCVGKSTYVLPTEGNDDAIVFNIVSKVLNIAKIFGVLFKTFADIEDLMNGLETGKHKDVWSGMTKERHKEVMDSMFTTWKRLMDENPSVASNVHVDKTSAPSHESPIVQAVDINPKTTSYAGAACTSAKDQPKFNSNFHPLVADPVFNGLTSLFLVKLSKSCFGGCLWMIRNSLIILKKWLMDTSLLKEELTRIPIWVKLHDVPLQVFEEDGISLIATFIGEPVMLDSYTSFMCNDSWGRSSFVRCLIKVNSKADLVDVVTIGIPSLTRDGFTKETIRVEYEWRPP